MGLLQKLFSIFSGGKKESAGPTSTTGSRPQATTPPQPQTQDPPRPEPPKAASPQTQDFQAPAAPKAPPPQTQDFQQPPPQQPASAEQPAEVSPDLLGGEGGPAGATMAFTLPTVEAASLVVRSGGEPGFIFGLKGERVTIGRTQGNDVQIDDPSVDSPHAQILIGLGRYLLSDLGSANGTWVNGEAVAGAPLNDGSAIKVGSTELVFNDAADDGPAAGMSRGTLQVSSGPSKGRSFMVGKADLVIGRRPGAGGLQVDDSTVSQRHAMVRPADEGVMIYDLGSANGTTVDGEALTGSLLKSGDVIKLGDAELEFSLNA